MIRTRFKKKTQEWVTKNAYGQKISSSKNEQKKCETCKFFDQSLSDLKSVGSGLCKAFPPFPFFIKTKGHTTYIS